MEVATVRGTKREAERALAPFVTEQPSAQVPASSRTFGELLERWFEARSGDWSPSRAQQTRWVINGNLKGLSDRKVAAIGVEDLDRYYAALRERGGGGGRPLAGSTVARTHTIVRLALKQAVVWGWSADNPAERANPGRYDSAEIQPPSATIALSAPAALVVAELRAQQVARAEACGITLPLNSFVFAADVDGSRPIRPETWTRRFTRLRVEVGLDTVRLHDLRHFGALPTQVARLPACLCDLAACAAPRPWLKLRALA